MINNEKKGKIGEDAFNKWLSDSNLAYVYICQSTKTFADLFKDNVKRPDFLLLIQSIGLIAIDVKNKTLHPKYNCFTLNYDNEFRRALMFESLFRIPLWYAFYHNNKWYWISSLKALEKGTIKNNSQNKVPFLAIKPEDFVLIEKAEDLSKLYTHFIDDLENVSKKMLDNNKKKINRNKPKSKE